MESQTVRTRVLLVDDHRTFTDLVAVALAGEEDLECLGAAHDGAQARRLVQELAPDVVLMDVNLGEEDGLDLSAELLATRPDLVVVVLTAYGDASVMRRASTVGVSALLPKDGSLPELLGGLRGARPGHLLVHPALLHTWVEAEQQPHDAPIPSLTPREQTVLQRLADGRTVVTIAKELGISVHTCRGHVRAIMAKLDVHSQLEAVVSAVILGLVDAPRRR